MSTIDHSSAVGMLKAAARSSADLILLNGRITTLDRQAPEVPAMAIRDGRFVAVGAEREIPPCPPRGATNLSAVSR